MRRSMHKLSRFNQEAIEGGAFVVDFTLSKRLELFGARLGDGVEELGMLLVSERVARIVADGRLVALDGVFLGVGLVGVLSIADEAEVKKIVVVLGAHVVGGAESDGDGGQVLALTRRVF